MNYKYVLQDIIGVVHFLYSSIRQEQIRAKMVYKPFVKNYFEIKTYRKEGTALNRFRACAWAVVAGIRLKNNVSSGRGLMKYARNALEKRYKI